MKAFEMSAWMAEVREPRNMWPGLSNGSFASSEPTLKTFNGVLVELEAESQVP